MIDSKFELNIPFKATENSKVLNEAFNRTLQIAIADWPDSNVRAAAITVALAALVCPEMVKVTAFAKWSYIEANYSFIRLVLSKDATKRGSIFWARQLSEDGSQNNSPISFPNLAQTYQDYERNLETRKFLLESLPKAKNRRDVSALLGIAWAKLQRMNISTCYQISPHDGMSGCYLSVEQINASVLLQADRIISVFPGM